MVFRKRVLALLVIDAILINLAIMVALWLRFEGDVPAQYMKSSRDLALLFTVTCLGCFYAFGLYRRLWQYASLGELLSIVYAALVATVLNVSVTYFWMQGGNLPLPRSVFILFWMALVMFIGGSRLSWRLFRDNHLTNGNGKLRAGRPVLIVGAGDAGAAVARELNKHSVDHSVPLGYIDDSRSKQGLEMFGLKVLGTREDIPGIVERYGIQEIIIAIPSASKKVVREIVEVCQETSARLKILPGMYELIDGTVTINKIREVQVEDILGRDPVEVDLESMAGYLTGKTVLVTGAGGSIGSELCRQVAQFQPESLILLGHGENSIYHIHNELINTYPDVELRPVVCDVKDETAVSGVFREYRPRVVFHAAAHKHVPLMEFNPVEAIKNNVLGTYCVASMSHRYSADKFILVSTDKAVNPTSIMGATKRVAEMVVQEVGKDSRTHFAAVRFGNVLGSRGSVVPLFKEQIARGGPVTVTHPEMIRYFMTIPEAVQLVIQAGALARSGEVFVLDMGEPVKIVDLAKNMIRLSGFVPGEDIEIVFSGVRPGEKLYEEMLTETEGTNATKHNRIYVAAVDRPDEDRLDNLLRTVTESGWDTDDGSTVRLLQGVIPGFRKPGEDRVKDVEGEFEQESGANMVAVN